MSDVRIRFVGESGSAERASAKTAAGILTIKTSAEKAERASKDLEHAILDVAVASRAVSSRGAPKTSPAPSLQHCVGWCATRRATWLRCFPSSCVSCGRPSRLADTKREQDDHEKPGSAGYLGTQKESMMKQQARGRRARRYDPPSRDSRVLRLSDSRRPSISRPNPAQPTCRTSSSDREASP